MAGKPRGLSRPDDWRRLARAVWRQATSRPARIALGVIFFAAGAGFIALELRRITLGEVLAAVRATRPASLAAAVALTAASYACLAATEWFAAAWLGHPLKPRRALAGAVAAYAISNTVGFSAASGTAMRLRSYRGDGLTPAQITRLAMLAGAAVTLSGPVTAGLALAAIALSRPGVLPWSPVVSAVVVAILVSPGALWFVAFRPAAPRFLGGGNPASAPAWRPRLMALCAGVADWAFSGAALFVLVPTAEFQAFAPFLAVSVAGALISAASGVPGGLGVFEAVVIGLTNRIHQTHETAAALLLYRLVYSLGPAVLVVAIAGARQAMRLGVAYRERQP